jgi:hypothetical protein
MANFTEKFNRHNPRGFKPNLLAPTWPSLLMQDALGHLNDFSDDELRQISQAVELEIREPSAPFIF